MALTKTEIVINHLKENPKDRSLPDRTLARIIYNKYKGVFSSLENARYVVKYVRGHMGKKQLKRLKDKTFVTPTTYNYNPFSDEPESFLEFKKPYILPKSATNILGLWDVHVPVHNKKTINYAIRYAKEHKCNTVFLGGDFMDMTNVSFHEPDVDLVYHFTKEIEIGISLLKYIKKELPKCKIYYKEGNHERRLSRYLRVQAPAIFGDSEYLLPSKLKLGELGIEWIPNFQPTYVGPLRLIHGNEVKGGGKNPAEVYLTKYMCDVIGGDKHRTSFAMKVGDNNKQLRGYSVGTMGPLDPNYNPDGNNHNLGFAHILVHKEWFDIRNIELPHNVFNK